MALLCGHWTALSLGNGAAGAGGKKGSRRACCRVSPGTGCSRCGCIRHGRCCRVSREACTLLTVLESHSCQWRPWQGGGTAGPLEPLSASAGPRPRQPCSEALRPCPVSLAPAYSSLKPWVTQSTGPRPLRSPRALGTDSLREGKDGCF